jgi:hypothetical protein
MELAKYVAEHDQDIKTARSCVLAGGQLRIMDRAWATTVAYMLIREGRNVSMLSDFFTVVNTGLPINGRECSPAIIIRNMFYMQATLTRKADEQDNMHFLVMAIQDFANGIKRKRTYALQSIVVNRAEELWHKIRKEDGIE